MVHRLTRLVPPPLTCTGYTSSVLVSSAYVRHWSVTVREEPLMRVLPRRWIDIHGERIDELWQAALRAVMGIVVFRPGVSQVRAALVCVHSDSF